MTTIILYRLPQWLGGKESPCNAGVRGNTGVISGSEDCLEEGMVTHSSILGWIIPRTEEPGRLQSIGLQKSDATEQLSMQV